MSPGGWGERGVKPGCLDRDSETPRSGSPSQITGTPKTHSCNSETLEKAAMDLEEAPRSPETLILRELIPQGSFPKS